MAEIVNLRNLSKEKYNELRVARWKARTDLGWLCRNILPYSDVSDNNGGPWRAIHQPIIDVLQKFPVPTQEQFDKNDVLVNGRWQYEPLVPMTSLKGKRRCLILDPRGHLKTTINSIAHTIQWIINYPNIAILIFMSSDTKAQDVLGEIKRVFQYNPKFRTLFPEHCPTKSIGDWGRADRFTTEARPKWILRKEPTVMTGAIEKGAAGYHFEVLKFSDIVDENNIVGDGCQRVLQKFDISHNLLVGSRFWIDVEGTRYSFADCYGEILRREEQETPESKQYNIHIRSVFKRNIPNGEIYQVSDMKMPFLKDENGKRIPWWPERWPLDELEREERNDPWQFSTQKLNWPISALEGQVHFPVNKKFPLRISRKDYEEHVRIAYKEITVDLAETDNKRSNYTCILVGAVNNFGQLYIEEIVHGRFTADIAVHKIFSVAMKHYRQLSVIKIEESSYLRGLMPTIQRVLDTQYRPKGINFEIETIKRGNRQHKAERIAKSLQPWYKNEDLRFLEDIDPAAWKHLLIELEQFPASKTDDILDAMADFLAEKEYFGREIPRANPQHILRDPSLAGTGASVSYNQRLHIFKRLQEEKWNKVLGLDNPFDPDSQFNVLEPVQDEWSRNKGIL